MLGKSYYYANKKNKQTNKKKDLVRGGITL